MTVATFPQPHRARFQPRRLALLGMLVGVLLLPPLVFHVDTLRGEPTASGAEPAYPLNHTFDADVQLVGTPANHDFEAASEVVGTSVANHDLAAGPVSRDFPDNHDFEAGSTIVDWTPSATGVSLQSATGQGNYVRFDSSAGWIESDAFAVSSTTQKLVFDIGRITASGNVWLTVSVTASGTTTPYPNISCPSSCSWQAWYLDLTSYQGQSVTVKFARHGSSTAQFGIDNVHTEEVLQGFSVSGSGKHGSDGGNGIATLNGGYIVSSSVEVASDAQYGYVDLKGMATTTDQYYIYVQVAPAYADAQVALGTVGDGAWEQIRFSLVAYRGETVRFKVLRFNGTIGVDNVGVQRIDVPGWDATETALRIDDGNGGTAISTDGELTSQPFTIPVGTQQLSIRYRGTTLSNSFYVELLRGPSFSTVSSLASGTVTAPQGVWTSKKFGIEQFEGETVKLRVRQWFGRPAFDDLGNMEVTVPGWTNLTTDGVYDGEDGHGTYVMAPTAATDTWLRSSDVDLGIVDRLVGSDQKYFSVSYEPVPGQTGIIRVNWVEQGGQVHQPFLDAAVSGPGLRTKYFWLADFMDQRGHFEVQVGGMKVYSLADNIARQQRQEPFSHKVGSGIDTSTGGFGYVDKDIALEGRMPLSFTRFYTALSDRYGVLGSRWSHSYDTRLEILSVGDVGVVFGSGGEEFFVWDSPEFVPADPRVNSTLVKNGDGSYTFTTSNNLKYQFTSAGRLTAIEDLNGNATTLAYDGSGRVETVTDPDGRQLTFTYTNGLLTSVAGPENTLVSYGYDGNGDLVSVTDPEAGVRTYEYDKHRLTEANDQNDDLLFANTYDAYHRVVTQTDALANTISLSYDYPAKGVTTVTDPLSNEAKYYFDVHHRTTDRVDPLGHVQSYLFDADGNVEKIIDPVNNDWEFEYDASGSVTSTTDPLGNSIEVVYNALHLPTTITEANGNVTEFTYDGDGNMLTMTDALDNVWTYTYDSEGNRLTEEDPLDNVTTYTYDAAGNMETKTDSLSNTWTYTYDGAGRKLSETDPEGNVWQWSYDLWGRLTSETNPLGDFQLYVWAPNGVLVLYQDEAGNQTTWSYDDRGLAVTRTDPLENDTTFTYDDNRRMTSMTDPEGNVTTWTYDDAGRLESTTDDEGGVWTYSYDAAGRLSSEEDPLDRVTSYTYNDAGRLLTKTLPNMGVWEYAYDLNGNLTVETNPLDHSTTYLYDALNRVTRVTDPLLNQTNYSYDDAGRLIEVEDALLQVTTYTYDDAGRRISESKPGSGTTTFGYDDAGRRVSVTDSLTRTTTYLLDGMGRVLEETNPETETKTYTYDEMGRMLSEVLPSGSERTWTYDARGLLLTEVDDLLNTIEHAYDEAGRRTSTTDARNYATTFGYDGVGRMTSMADAQSGTVSFVFDDAGQLTSRTNARGKTTTFTYNAIGKVLTETDPEGRVLSWTYDLLGQPLTYEDGRGIEQAYVYDAKGRMTTTAYPGGAVLLAYDALGRRVEMTDSTGTTTWDYDNASRVTEVASPQGTVTYTYNTAGERASMGLPGSRVVDYTYDGAGRLDSLTDWNSSVITFSYDVDGRRTGIAYPNGVVSAFTYDTAGRLTEVEHTKTGTPLQSFAYDLDANGNRIEVTHNGGTESYVLDSLNRITQVTYPNTDVVQYSYDANGNRLTQTVNGGTPTSYTYDDADKLLSAGGQSFTYDDNGNPLSDGTGTYTWDYASRLSSATVGSVTTDYEYDGTDVRVGKDDGTTGTTYLWDRQTGLPLMVEDGTNAYLHAGGVLASIPVTGSSQYLLGDALGSVRGVSDSSGMLSGTADYDVFGAVRASSGGASIFGFAGEQRDSETGWTFLRARYLEPALGRFTSTDTVQPNAPGTQGFNLYAYVANNPTTWVDPSGRTVPPVIEKGGASVGAILLAYMIAYPDDSTYNPIWGCINKWGGDIMAKVWTVFCLAGVAFAVLACVFTPGCLQAATIIAAFLIGWRIGTAVGNAIDDYCPPPCVAPQENYPAIPRPRPIVDPRPTGLGGQSRVASRRGGIQLAST